MSRFGETEFMTRTLRLLGEPSTMGHEDWYTFCLGVARMQDPDCILLGPLLSFVFAVNNLEGWGDVFSSYREQVYYYKSSKFPKLSVPFLKCSPLFMKTSIRPTYIIPVGFGRAWWAKANQWEVMVTVLSWVIKSFVSDLWSRNLMSSAGTCETVSDKLISLLAGKKSWGFCTFLRVIVIEYIIFIRSSSDSRMEQWYQKEVTEHIFLSNFVQSSPENYQWSEVLSNVSSTLLLYDIFLKFCLRWFIFFSGVLLNYIQLCLFYLGKIEF